MAADRPSSHPLGYWLSSTPATMPSHAYPDWLLEMMGFPRPPDGGDEQQQQEGPPRSPIVPWTTSGNPIAGNALRRPGAPPMASAGPYNALRMFYGS